MMDDMSWPGHHTAFRWTPSLACGWAIAPDRLNFQRILCYHYIEDEEERRAELASRKPRSEDENYGKWQYQGNKSTRICRQVYTCT